MNRVRWFTVGLMAGFIVNGVPFFAVLLGFGILLGESLAMALKEGDRK